MQIGILSPPASFLLVLAFLAPSFSRGTTIQQPIQNEAIDSDHDGISDALEQSLLLQFAPTFMVDPARLLQTSCGVQSQSGNPDVEVEDGTIYGQVFLAKSASARSPHRGNPLLPSLAHATAARTHIPSTPST